MIGDSLLVTAVTVTPSAPILLGRSRWSKQDARAGEHRHDDFVKAEQIERVLDGGKWLMHANDADYFGTGRLRKPRKRRIQSGLRLRDFVILRIDDAMMPTGRSWNEKRKPARSGGGSLR